MTAAAAAADVIVIGAGLSGLVCATRLAAGGARVRVLEARDRVGGRLLGRRVGGARFDLGGQWWTNGQTRLAALAAELGIARVAQFRSGESIVALATPPRSLPGRIVDLLVRGRRLAAISRLIARAGTDPDPAWDHTSLAAYLERAVPDAALRRQVEIHCEMTFAADPRELSLLDYLAQLAATSDPFDGAPGHEHRLVPGAHALADRLAEPLTDRISLSTPVRAIAVDRERVTVATATATLVATHVVLALPPRAARAIAFTPALPPSLAAAISASRPGPVVKCVATYDRAFWRDDGRSGEAYRAPGLVRATVDATHEVPALAAFVVASEAAAFTLDRAPQVLDDLRRLFGDAAASPTDFAFHDWGNDPWSGGCVAGLPPGARSAGAAWRGPHGRLHLAGTEAATRWLGFMEGAIDAAERTAAAILDPDLTN